MKIKEYFKLLLKTTYSPRKAMEEVCQKNTKFHMLYYLTFNFILGVIMLLIAIQNPDIFTPEGIPLSGPNEGMLILIFGIPFLLLMFSMYIDFAQYQIFKIKGLTLDYFKILLWVYHQTIYLLALTSILSILLLIPDIEIINKIVGVILLSPFINFLILSFIGLTASSTKSWWKTIVVFTIGIGSIYAITYLF